MTPSELLLTLVLAWLVVKTLPFALIAAGIGTLEAYDALRRRL